MSIHDTPDPIKELERKAAETLGLVLNKIEAAEWSFERAIDALDILWSLAAGLIPEDDMDQIAETHGFCQRMIKQGHKDYDDVLRAHGD
ncbi:MAG: hypothetical protein KI788_15835 [Mameliella sp.]|nr:hypothetical protein [Mameliella sp.]